MPPKELTSICVKWLRGPAEVIGLGMRHVDFPKVPRVVSILYIPDLNSIITIAQIVPRRGIERRSPEPQHKAVTTRLCVPLVELQIMPEILQD